MSSATRSRIRVGTALLLAFLLTGCGGPKSVKVRGKLLAKGEPLKVSRQTYVTIIFAPVNEDVGQTHPATFNYDDGTYSVTVPEGNYKVKISVVPPDRKGPLIRSSPNDEKTYDLKADQQIDLELPK
jgi:hypothetical protein